VSPVEQEWHRSGYRARADGCGIKVGLLDEHGKTIFDWQATPNTSKSNVQLAREFHVCEAACRFLNAGGTLVELRGIIGTLCASLSNIKFDLDYKPTELVIYSDCEMILENGSDQPLRIVEDQYWEYWSRCDRQCDGGGPDAEPC